MAGASAAQVVDGDDLSEALGESLDGDDGHDLLLRPVGLLVETDTSRALGTLTVRSGVAAVVGPQPTVACRPPGGRGAAMSTSGGSQDPTRGRTATIEVTMPVW
jgi:hypothetical protein